MHIVRATPAHAEALTAVAHAAKRHWGYPEPWILAWRDALTLTSQYIGANPTYVEWGPSEALGFCAVVFDGPAAHLDHLWVLPSAMGRGIGRALFAQAEQVARSAGASRLKIEGDPNAAGFYQRMGAVPCGHLHSQVEGQPRCLPLFEKVLG